MAGPQHGLGTEAGWRVLPGALGRLSPSIRKHGAPCLRSQSGKRRCRVPARPARGSRRAELTCRDVRGRLLRHAQARCPREQGKHPQQAPRPRSAAPHSPLRPGTREACGGDFSRDAETPERAGPDPGPGRRKAAAVVSGRRGLDGHRSGRRARKGLTRRRTSERSGQPDRRCRRRPLKSGPGGRAGPGAGRCSRTPRPRPSRLSPHPPSRLRLRAPPHARAPRSCGQSALLPLPSFWKLPRRALARPPLLNRALARW